MTIDAIQLSDSTPQVLVIDDSEDVHRLLRTRLRQESLELVCASNGAEGLEAARELVPAVILLDLNMPELDGFEVLRTLKEDQATMNVPVIVLSGLNSPQDKVMAFDLGAMDYICKPFDLTELRIRVRSAVRLSELVQMLAQRAQIDGLTGLYNRAHFDLRWPDELAGCVRHGRAISLAIFDCDHFKSINDTYGHPAGDTVLKVFAQVLRRECRQADIPCRFGGEEFCLVMPDTTPHDALQVCDRIRSTIADVKWRRHPDRCVTVSIGMVGGSVGVEQESGRWLEAVDQHLYAAKERGRNRIEWSDLGTTPARLAAAS